MKKILLALLIAFSVPAYAADAEKPAAPPSQRDAVPAAPAIPVVVDMVVENAYAFTTTSAQKTGAVFLTISNNGTVDDRLTAASATDVAASADLHTNVIEENTVTMTKVDGYDIPATEILTLDPHGHHIMLNDLKAPLKEGDTFKLTLTFAKKGEVVVDVAIRAPGSEEKPAEDHEHKH